MIDLACRDWLIERRSVTSCDHGSTISRCQQFFLTEMAIGMEEKYGLPFVQSCTGKSYKSIFSFFFLPHLQDHATMAT